MPSCAGASRAGLSGEHTARGDGPSTPRIQNAIRASRNHPIDLEDSTSNYPDDCFLPECNADQRAAFAAAWHQVDLEGSHNSQRLYSERHEPSRALVMALSPPVSACRKNYLSFRFNRGRHGCSSWHCSGETGAYL